jgi:hypothetical protein
MAPASPLLAPTLALMPARVALLPPSSSFLPSNWVGFNSFNGLSFYLKLFRLGT